MLFELSVSQIVVWYSNLDFIILFGPEFCSRTFVLQKVAITDRQFSKIFVHDQGNIIFKKESNNKTKIKLHESSSLSGFVRF